MYLPEVNERNTGNINPVLHVITLYQVFISAQTLMKLQRFVGRFVSDDKCLLNNDPDPSIAQYTVILPEHLRVYINIIVHRKALCQLKYVSIIIN